MPQIPIYDTPQATPQNVPDIRLQAPTRLMSFADLGPGETIRTGQNLQQAGAEANQIAVQQQIQQNETEAKNLHAQMVQATTAALYGDPQSNTPGYSALRGQAAVDAAGDTLDSLGKTQKQLLEGASNDAVRNMLQGPMASTLNSATSAIANHKTQQQHVAAVDSSAARASALTQAMAVSYNPVPGADNSYFFANRAALEAEVASSASDPLTLGLEGDALKQHVHDTLATADASVVQHLLNNNQTAGAKQYLDSVRSLLPVAVGDRLGEQVQVGSSKDAGLDTALQLQKDHPNDFGAQEEALKDLRRGGKLDATTYDVALQHLSADVTRQDHAQRQAETQFLGKYYNQIMQAKGNFKLSSMSPADYDYMTRNNLGPTLTGYINAAQPDTAKTDDSATFFPLLAMSADPDNRQAFADMNLLKVGGSLTKPHLQALIERQGQIKSNAVKREDPTDMAVRGIQRMKIDLEAAGFDTNPKPGTSAARQMEQLFTAYHDEVALRQKEAGKPLADEDLTRIGHALIKDQSLAGTETTLFGMKIGGPAHKPVYQMTPDQRAAPFVVPPADRSRITSFLQKKGMPVTEDSIQKMYKGF
jgi:hypothetical protein